MATTGSQAARVHEDDTFEVLARLKLLEQTLTQPLAFREESASRPLVYGYVRSATYQPLYVEACRRALERYCHKEKLSLCGVFIDHGVSADTVVRPGLAGLCDVLRLPDSFAAVMLRADHLSSDERLARLLAERVRASGARLLFARPQSTCARPPAHGITALPGSGPYAGLPQWWQ